MAYLNIKEGIMEKIVNENYIWDLHIHTCKCPKSSGEFSKMDVNQYVDGLVACFKKYPDLKMISFTDHNHMSSEVYKLFNDKNTNITVIPGVEVDFKIDSEQIESDFKQIIIYFDIKTFKIDSDSEKINKYLKNKTPINIQDFLKYLIVEIKVPFLLSPHFMKQGKRSINYNWDSEEAKKNIDLYIDQMFCFWETSSIRNIQYGIQFLKDFNKEKKVSIISFSDSHDFETLNKYLEKPNQYFLALPSFNGIRMVGSDCRRISSKKEKVLDENKGNFLGEICIGEQTINLSNKLNVVIGGRGSGKSILLDGIYLCKDANNVLNPKERQSYVLDKKIKIYDMNNKVIKSKNFEFDYYNQGYINKLFNNNNDIVNSEYFVKEFNSLEDFNEEKTKVEIIEDLDFIKVEDVIEECNVCSLSENILKISSQNEEVKIKNVSLIKKIDIDEDLLIKMKKALNSSNIVPKALQTNTNIIDCKNALMKTVLSEVSMYNQGIIEKSEFHNNIYNNYKTNLNAKNKMRKQKNKTLELVQSKFMKFSIPYINRVNIINAIIKLNGKDRNISHHSNAPIIANGNDKFTFSKELIVEKPIDYLFRQFNEYFDSNKCLKNGIKKSNIHDLDKMIFCYCYGNDLTMDSKKISDLDSELFGLIDLKINVSKEIFYEHENKKSDIRSLSPGSKANILMEYIVFKNSDIPLILDQPEDNIDNRTIYKQLTNWINSLKNKRQLIIATHDANIVINADTENVIMCKQDANDIFTYDYGSLEYGDMLDDVAELLEGGRKAIERRLLKYGEKEEFNDKDKIV